MSGVLSAVRNFEHKISNYQDFQAVEFFSYLAILPPKQVTGEGRETMGFLDSETLYY